MIILQNHSRTRTGSKQIKRRNRDVEESEENINGVQ